MVSKSTAVRAFNRTLNVLSEVKYTDYVVCAQRATRVKTESKQPPTEEFPDGETVYIEKSVIHDLVAEIASPDKLEFYYIDSSNPEAEKQHINFDDINPRDLDVIYRQCQKFYRKLSTMKFVKNSKETLGVSVDVRVEDVDDEDDPDTAPVISA